MNRDELHDRDWQRAVQRLKDLDPDGERLLDFAYEITGNERHVCNENCQHELEELLSEAEGRAIERSATICVAKIKLEKITAEMTSYPWAWAERNEIIGWVKRIQDIFSIGD